MACTCSDLMSKYQEDKIKAWTFFKTEERWQPIEQYYKDKKDGDTGQPGHNCLKVIEVMLACEQRRNAIIQLEHAKLKKNTPSAAYEREIAVQHYFKGLSHAYRCYSQKCKAHKDCGKYKKLINHWKSCKKRKSKTAGQPCRPCKEFLSLLGIHAGRCRNTQINCIVPLCRQLKLHIERNVKGEGIVRKEGCLFYNKDDPAANVLQEPPPPSDHLNFMDDITEEEFAVEDPAHINSDAIVEGPLSSYRGYWAPAPIRRRSYK